MLSKYFSYLMLSVIFFATTLLCISPCTAAPTQFRNTEMMTARGFGKRDNWQSRLIERLIGGYNDNKRGAGLSAEPRLRFRMDSDDGLRIGRGFGKRAGGGGGGQKEEYTRPWSSPSIKDWNDAERLLQDILQSQGAGERL